MVEPPRPRPASRRRYERVRVPDAPLEAHRLSFLGLFASRANLGQWLMNVSEIGAGLLLAEKAPIGTRLRIRARIPAFNDTLEGEVVVRWVAQCRGGWLTGAEFVSMPAGQAMKVQQLRRAMSSAQYRQRRSTADRERRTGADDGGLEIVISSQ